MVGKSKTMAILLMGSRVLNLISTGIISPTVAVPERGERKRLLAEVVGPGVKALFFKSCCRVTKMAATKSPRIRITRPTILRLEGSLGILYT